MWYEDYYEKTYGKTLTGCGCCWLIIFTCIFIPLYLRGQENEIKTQCEVLERKGKGCIYQNCYGTGKNRRCTTHSSRKYKHKYLLYHESCENKTFSEWGSCRGSEEYNIGKVRTCYIEEGCNDPTFNSGDTYMIWAWIMLSFMCISFCVYLLGIYCYYLK